MALHTQLPIYKVTYDLLALITKLTASMPRDFKRSLGDDLRNECVRLSILVYRANSARNKVPHLAELLERLHVHINPRKTILQPVARGIDFVGQVIKPWSHTTRRRSYRQAIERGAHLDGDALFETANSYFGLLGQATHSHHDRARLANVLRRRGYSINHNMTKTFRRGV
ncbi:Retron-type reverse transcriptase [Pseudogulbenkiania sp. NH8B]|uniref:four helix bundle protein n=1 Tax=Pseudogulbenkiania sp. (strain NH8B) TaxID=748280 RepID=UPI0002279590|nr:four helix bundle protein [Pseudogulbenkiania sp. NH8B]BAK75427.1 Retron-type reverse transcriptase [Pseudogulbenkiania sp. NH8B]